MSIGPHQPWLTLQAGLHCWDPHTHHRQAHTGSRWLSWCKLREHVAHTYTHTASAAPHCHHSSLNAWETAQQPKGPDVCHPPTPPPHPPPHYNLLWRAQHTHLHTHTHTTKYMLHSVEVRSQNTDRQVAVSTGAEHKSHAGTHPRKRRCPSLPCLC